MLRLRLEQKKEEKKTRAHAGWQKRLSPMDSYILEMALPRAAAKNSVALSFRDTLGSSSCLKNAPKNGVRFLSLGGGLSAAEPSPAVVSSPCRATQDHSGRVGGTQPRARWRVLRDRPDRSRSSRSGRQCLPRRNKAVFFFSRWPQEKDGTRMTRQARCPPPPPPSSFFPQNERTNTKDGHVPQKGNTYNTKRVHSPPRR